MSVENMELIDPNNTVHIIIDADMTVIDAEVAFEQMEQIAKNNGSSNLLIEIDDVRGIPAFKSIYKSRKFKWFAVQKVRKCAIISDNKWGEYLTEATNFLIPGINIRDFGMDDAQEAIVWLNAPSKPRDHGLAIARNQSFLHVMVYDALTAVDLALLKIELDKFNGKATLLIELDYFKGFSLRKFWATLNKGFPASEYINAIALVSNNNLKVVFESTEDITPGAKLALFPADALQEAISFLNKVK